MMDKTDDELFIALVIKDGRFEELCSKLETGAITIAEVKKKTMEILEELAVKYNSIVCKGKMVH
jgi:hypothetical protein